MQNHSDLVIVGGGIGGMAAALALQRAGARPRVVERTAVFSEVGAGVQLGPNVTRVLARWGLEKPLLAVAAEPRALMARDAQSGALLGHMPLARDMRERYGAPYLSIHRADLHGLLADAVAAQGVSCAHGLTLTGIASQGAGVALQLSGAQADDTWLAEGLIGADGLWSPSRAALGLTDAPVFSGHLAYRALLPMRDVPQALREVVTVWMAPEAHVVQYPVRRGEWCNLVVLMEGALPPDPQSWDQAAQADVLRMRLGRVAPDLARTLEAAPPWRLWALHERPVLTSAAQMAHGPVALLGDAAHPMRPYLAQGAGMAIEDAQALAEAWQLDGSLAGRWQHYAAQRWARNARVQARARRNGVIFHAQGWLARARNASLRVAGARLMDVPWLYREGASRTG